jgi:hypothetical protein
MDKKRNNRNLIMDKMIAEYLDTLDTKKQDFLKKEIKVNSTEKEIIAFNKKKAIIMVFPNFNVLFTGDTKSLSPLTR